MTQAAVVLPRLRTLFADAIADEFPRTNVFLGPIASQDPDDAVFVGYDGDPFGDMEMVVHTQNWGALGNNARDEEFDVRCCILNRAGAEDEKAVNAAVERMYRMYMLIADRLHDDPSIGLGPSTPNNAPIMQCSIRGIGTYMSLTETGVEPRVSFSVHVRTRLRRNG